MLHHPPRLCPTRDARAATLWIVGAGLLLRGATAAAQPAAPAPEVGGVAVQSPGTCPSAEAVRDELRPLLPERAPRDPGLSRAVISAAGEGRLWVELRDTDGEMVARKLFEPTPSCAESARAAAIFIAAWAGRDNLSATIDAPTPAPAAPVPAPAAPPVTKTPPSVASPAAAAVVLKNRPVAAAPPPATADEGQPIRVGADAQLASGLAPTAEGPGPAVGFTLSARLARGANALDLGVTSLGSRSLALSNGSVSWQRTAITATLARTVAAWGKATSLDARVAAIIAHTRAAGVGFALDETAQSWTPGLGLGVGANLALSDLLRGRAAVTVAVWGPEERAAIGAGAGRQLPRIEVFFSLGVGFEWAPVRPAAAAASTP